MAGNIKAMLQNKKTRKDLELSFTDILQGISKEWNLTAADLAQILFVPEPTVKEWMVKEGCMTLPPHLDHNTQSILDFIDVYNCLRSFFVKLEDSISWFKEPNERFGSLSPMEFIKVHPHNLVNVRSQIRHLMNP